MRPNIRIEIQNNLAEAMDVDNDNEEEEGEIADDDAEEISSKHLPQPALEVPKLPVVAPTSTKSTFTTGIDLLSKEDLDKLQKRAERFKLKPDEIANFTEEEFRVLHKSLGITHENESTVRFEVVHMTGIEKMTAEDILEYFLKYAPVALEWVNDESCNVVCSDKLSAARALHFVSKPVQGMPARIDRKYVDDLHEAINLDEPNLIGSLRNQNREVELQEDTSSNDKINCQKFVDISEIHATIPPGYWRLGDKHPKSNCLLLRFSLKTDLQPYRIEQFHRYYRNHSNKSGEKGPLPGIFSRNKEMTSGEGEKDPWSVLAKNWDEDEQFREQERRPPIASLVPIPPIAEDDIIAKRKNSLKIRLGYKRKRTPSPSPPPSESEPEEEEEEEEVEFEVTQKNSKIPRMRMYADDEEERMKRKELLKAIKDQYQKIARDEVSGTDLRSVLTITNTRRPFIKSEEREEVFDLGTTLRSRKKGMIFEVKTEAGAEEIQPPKENLCSRSSRMDDELRVRRRRSFERERERARERERHRRTRRRYEDRDRYEEPDYRHGHRTGKPQSKVAVVIKTQKTPTVASTVGSSVWSRVNRPSSSSSSSESEDESKSSSSSGSSDPEPEVAIEQQSSFRKTLNRHRPGFDDSSTRRLNQKMPLKIEISNDHFKRN